jgi:hypothetical protein
VGAGWIYGADGDDAILFSLYVGALLLVARLVAGPLVKIPAVRTFFVFLIVFYLVPGWYFHFIHGMNAVLFTNLFLRLKLSSQPLRKSLGRDEQRELQITNT